MTDMLRRVSLTAVTGLGLCLTLLPAGQAQAQAPQAPVRVPCNDIAALRTAIDNANAAGPNASGRIALAPHCVYSLTAADNADDGLPEITGNVRISGDRSTIQRAPGATTAFRIFHVRQQGSLTLDSVTVRGGTAFVGGAVYNESGRVTLNRATLRNNSSEEAGGAIWNSLGTLVLRDTTVRDNDSDIGGGVATNGTMTMRGGSLRDNTVDLWGGGLANAGNTTLNRTSVDGNTSGAEGGGILTLNINDRTGPLRLNSTRVANNIAQRQGGGILVGSVERVTLYRSIVTRNAANGGPGSGGGIRLGIGALSTSTSPVTKPRRNTGAAPTPSQVNLIRSAVFKNTPDNCAPPNSIPRCNAVGSAPAKNTTKPGRS